MKYQLKEPATVDAFAVTELSPDFHGHQFALTDDGTVTPILTGAAALDDYLVQGTGTAPDHFEAKAAFEALYAPFPG